MCVEFGISLINLRFLMVVDVSKANGCLESSDMVCFESDWWPVGTANFRVLTSIIALPQL
jgi:hypothetical protein